MYGQPYLTDHIFEEAVTVTPARTGSHDAAVSLGRRLRGVGEYPLVYELLRVDHATFDDALDSFETYVDQGLSFTDATSVAVCQRAGHVCSSLRSGPGPGLLTRR